IAPTCDIAGESFAGCPVLTPTGANGHSPATAAGQTVWIGAATNKCSSSLDDDFDGVVNARDSCISGMNPPITFPDLAPPGGAEPGSAILTASANSGATQITVDNTSGFVNAQPIVIGSPLETVRYINPSGINDFGNTIQFSPPLISAHPAGAPVAQVSFAQSLGDLNNDGFVDMSGDISVVGGAFGSRGGDPANDGVGDSGVPGYEGRFDLNYDSFIDVIGDISLLGGVFAASCGPP